MCRSAKQGLWIWSQPTTATTFIFAVTAEQLRGTVTWSQTDIDAPYSDQDTLTGFLMYYCMTADKLTRTSVWVEKLEGGIDHIREVIIDDKLGICNELERMMQFVVDSYRCEWKEVVRNSERRKWFRQFVNTDDTEPVIEIISRARPVAARRLAVQNRYHWIRSACWMVEHWANTNKSNSNQTKVDPSRHGGETSPWMAALPIKYGNVQIAVFNFSSRGAWYACQQMCPHKKAFVLSRGILGDSRGTPKVACPLHKRNFSLKSGACTSDDDYSVRVFPVKVDAEDVYLDLPPTEVLDKLLATEIGCKLATSCESNPNLVASAGV